MCTFNQGIPSVSHLISTANCLIVGNTSSGNALRVQQLGAGNVASFRTTTGSTALFVSSAGNVGVGTVGPAANFHVYGSSPYRIVTDSSGATDAKSWWESYSGGNAVFYCANDANNASAQWMVVNRSGYTPQYISWLTGGAERMRIDVNGRVGIGTASPGYALDVSGSARVNTGTSNVLIGAGQGAGQGGLFMIPQSSIAGSSWNLGCGLQGSYANAITFTSGTNVGIGTTNPGATFDVSGLFRVDGAAGSPYAQQGASVQQNWFNGPYQFLNLGAGRTDGIVAVYLLTTSVWYYSTASVTLIYYYNLTMNFVSLNNGNGDNFTQSGTYIMNKNNYNGGAYAINYSLLRLM